MGRIDDDALVNHRLLALEKVQSEHEGRIRALEIGYAKILGWAAGGAFVGGAAVQVLTWLVK